MASGHQIHVTPHELKGLSSRLRRARGKASLRDVADGSGLSRTSVFRAEQGEQVPTLGVVLRLADHHGLSLDRLMGRAFQ